MSETEPGGPKVVTAAVIVIGNELLSGRTRDKNLHYLAGRLTELGVRLQEARVIPDVEDVIVATVNQLRARFDYVFTSGGIGPTHDDITADAIAKAFGVGIDYHPEALKILGAQYQPGEFNQARKRMARIPLGGVLVANPVSRAPGFRLENVYVFAGVPAILRAMFEGIRHELVGGTPVMSRTISSAVPEGRMARGLEDLQGRYAEVEMGSYPYYRMGAFGTSIVLRSVDRDQLDAAARDLKQLIRDLGQEPVEGEAA